MSAAQDATIEKSRRNTGDWHGLPFALCLIALLCALGAAISVFAAFADASNFFRRDASMMDWVIAGYLACSGLGVYCIAAVIAVLRGILNATIR